jgi:hypothetical protein
MVLPVPSSFQTEPNIFQGSSVYDSLQLKDFSSRFVPNLKMCIGSLSMKKGPIIP